MAAVASHLRLKAPPVQLGCARSFVYRRNDICTTHYPDLPPSLTSLALPAVLGDRLLGRTCSTLYPRVQHCIVSHDRSRQDSSVGTVMTQLLLVWKGNGHTPSSPVMVSMVRGTWESMLCWRPPKLVARALSNDCIAQAAESCGDGRSWQRHEFKSICCRSFAFYHTW